MAIFSNKKGIRKAKEAAGGQQHAAIRAAEAVSAQQARDMAAEQAKMGVWSMLGSDNLFDTDYQNQRNVDDPNSVWDKSGLGFSQPDQDLRSLGPNDPAKNSILSVAREGVLDPESYANSIANTAQFRIQSQRVRESEQLLNREGPAWDMLENSVLGTINEGSALQLRDTVRKLKNQYAKGGTARRAAMYEVQELAAGERAMRTRVQETWQANLALFDSVRQNADRVAAGTQSFMAGLPLVNDSYRDAMQRTTAMQIQASSLANTAIMQAYDTKMTQQPVNFGENFVEGLVKLVPAAVATYFSGGAIGGSEVGSALGQMFGGAPNKGYTGRGTSAYGGSSDGGIMGDVLKSGLNYLNDGKPATYAGGDQSDDPTIADRYGSGSGDVGQDRRDAFTGGVKNIWDKIF
jgi:hypothetical protein